MDFGGLGVRRGEWGRRYDGGGGSDGIGDVDELVVDVEHLGEMAAETS